MNFDELNHNDETQTKEPDVKYLKGAQVKNLFDSSLNAITLPSQSDLRSQTLVSTDFNQRREKVNFRNYSCTFSIKSAHTERINCLTYLSGGIFMSGSNDKFIRIWNPLESKPMGSLEEDFPVTHLIKMAKNPS